MERVVKVPLDSLLNGAGEDTKKVLKEVSTTLSVKSTKGQLVKALLLMLETLTERPVLAGEQGDSSGVVEGEDEKLEEEEEDKDLLGGQGSQRTETQDTAKYKDVCHNFRKGKCQIRRQCKDGEHPAIFWKHSKHGADPTQGCDKGRECQKFHARVCKSSYQRGVCYKERCAYTFHLKGTRRYRDSAPVFRPEEHQHPVTQGQSHQDVGLLHYQMRGGAQHRGRPHPQDRHPQAGKLVEGQPLFSTGDRQRTQHERKESPAFLEREQANVQTQIGDMSRRMDQIVLLLMGQQTPSVSPFSTAKDW
jgi:hypothetical protein